MPPVTGLAGARTPADHPSVRAFAPVQNRTHCIYAPSSRLWGSSPNDPGRTPEENVAALVPELCDFIDNSRALRLDGYVIELPAPRFGADIPALASTAHAVLRVLGDLDPAGDGWLDRDIESVSWSFGFGGEPIFVNTFAPCYPSNHSRYTFGSQSTFVLLQPRHSFGRVLRPGETVLPPEVRQRIRSGYADSGRGYDPGISASPFEAWRIVRPLRPDELAVRWWEAPAVFP